MRGAPQKDAIRGWQNALSELETAAKEYNPDGIPVAIEGLEMLASYLEVADDGGDPSLTRLSRAVRRLAPPEQGI